MAKKWIINNGQFLMSGSVSYHKELAKDHTTTKGGGLWHLEGKNLYLYYKSMDFGYSRVEDVAKAIKEGFASERLKGWNVFFSESPYIQDAITTNIQIQQGVERQINTYEIFCEKHSQIIQDHNLLIAVSQFIDKNPDEKVIYAQDVAYAKINQKGVIDKEALQTPFKDEKFIANVCMSYRHDFGLLTGLEKRTLKFEIEEIMRAIINNYLPTT